MISDSDPLAPLPHSTTCFIGRALTWREIEPNTLYALYDRFGKYYGHIQKALIGGSWISFDSDGRLLREGESISREHAMNLTEHGSGFIDRPIPMREGNPNPGHITIVTPPINRPCVSYAQSPTAWRECQQVAHYRIMLGWSVFRDTCSYCLQRSVFDAFADLRKMKGMTGNGGVFVARPRDSIDQ